MAFEVQFDVRISAHLFYRSQVYADMDDVDPFDDGEAIVARLKASLVKSAAAGCVVRALLIVNPNNPLGRCYPAQTLTALMKFCRDFSVHFISDEVYALSVYDTEETKTGFTSALAVHSDELLNPDMLHVLYGMSKVSMVVLDSGNCLLTDAANQDFGSAGLRIGCLITRNALLRKAMCANARFHAVSGPSLAIASEVLENRNFVEHLIGLSRQRLANARKITTDALAAAGVRWYKGG